MRAACNMPNNVASERRESMINVDHRFGSLESLKPIVKQSGFTSDNVLDAAYALAREESLKRLSPLAVQVMRYGQMMGIYMSDLSNDIGNCHVDCS